MHNTIAIDHDLLSALVDAAIEHLRAKERELEALEELEDPEDPDNWSAEWVNCRIEYENLQDTVFVSKALLRQAEEAV